MGQIAVSIEHREIPADEPIASRGQRIFVRSAPVAQHQTGFAAVDRQKSGLSRWKRVRTAVEGQDRDPAAALRLAHAAGADWHLWPAGDEGGTLAHPQGLVKFASGGGEPGVVDGGGQRLSGGQAMAQACKIGTVAGGVFEDLPVKRGDRRKKGGTRGSDQPGPYADVARSDVKHSRSADRPGIQKPDAKRVAPVEGTGVQHHVVAADSLPIAAHRRATEYNAVGVNDALGTPARARGVDHVSRVLGGSIGIGGQGWSGFEPGNIGGAQNVDAGYRLGEIAGNDHCGCQGILQQHRHFVIGQLRRNRDRHQSRRNGTEEQ